MNTDDTVGCMGKQGMTAWQKWLERPDKLWVRNMFFQVHFWIGAAAGAYILLMSVSGSVIVYRNELSGNSFVEWVVRLHENFTRRDLAHSRFGKR
jgi:hypothetical protein